MTSGDDTGARPEDGSGKGEPLTAVPLLALDTKALLLWFSGVLATKAWMDLGLLADPVHGGVSKNIEDARVAIDGVGSLLEVLRGKVDPGEVRELERVLADLRLNFVRQAREETGGEAAKEAAGGTDTKTGGETGTEVGRETPSD